MWMLIYKSIMQLSTPLLKAYLKKRLRQGKEDPLRFKERLGFPLHSRENKPLVWFHAASVGEALSLLVLINKILEDYPNVQIMLTTGTVTSARLMEKRLPERAFHQYIPVDHPRWTKRFLDFWKPDLVVWTESEFWPNILSGVKKRNIPAILLNARMSQPSFKKWQWAKGLIKDILGCFYLCLGQNKAEVDRLIKLGAVNAKISGNLKYAAKILPYDKEAFKLLRAAIGDRPTVLWAVTHRGEEEIACHLHKSLLSVDPKLLTIILPRHPERKDEIEEIINKANLKFCARSTGTLPEADDDIYIADTMGETGLFYKASPLCIMGGSFIPWGGHNIIEPAQFGCQIFYGPHMHNFISICEDFEKAKGVLKVTDGQMLRDNMAVALRDHEYFAPMARQAKQLAEDKAHVLDELAKELAPFINKVTTEQRIAS